MKHIARLQIWIDGILERSLAVHLRSESAEAQQPVRWSTRRQTSTFRLLARHDDCSHEGNASDHDCSRSSEVSRMPLIARLARCGRGRRGSRPDGHRSVKVGAPRRRVVTIHVFSTIREWYQDWRRPLRGILAALGVLVLHACSVPSGPPASNGAAQAFLSPWMASTDYQQEFDRQFRDGFYPARVEGRLGSTGTEFRASFVPFAAEPFFFFSYHGMDQPHYDARRVHLAAEGFCQISRQAFVDRLGTKRYQSTWVRGPACNNAPALLPECSACSAETTADQDGGSAGADAGSYEADCSTH
jgi:hypothetical protein